MAIIVEDGRYYWTTRTELEQFIEVIGARTSPTGTEYSLQGIPFRIGQYSQGYAPMELGMSGNAWLADYWAMHGVKIEGYITPAIEAAWAGEEAGQRQIISGGTVITNGGGGGGGTVITNGGGFNLGGMLPLLLIAGLILLVKK